MPRIPGVSAKEGGIGVKLAYFFTRRALRKETGRAPGGGIAPLEMYAYSPGLLRAYGLLEQATGKLSRLDRRLRGLAELKAATVVECEFCIDLGSEIARRWGISDEHLLALANHRQSPLFTPLEKLVLDYATCMSRTPVDVPNDLFATLRSHLIDGQIVELTHIIALENLRGRFNLALGIGAAGYSEGRVCAVPASATDLDAAGVASRQSASGGTMSQNTRWIDAPVSEPVTMINVFSVPVREAERFLQRWKDNARAMATQPGMIRARMYRALADEVEIRFVNVAEWESGAALSRARSNPEWRVSTERLLQDPELHVVARPAIYEVALEFRRGGS